MADYIDREKIFSIWRSMPAPASVTSLAAAISQTPAAEVVEVVRCDHCERRYEEDGEYFCSRTDMPCADDDFCSYGQRKIETVLPKSDAKDERGEKD